VLDDGIGSREYQAGVTILKSHEVRRLTSGSVNLKDLAHAVGLADDLGVHV
jgi:hypothetical protein